MLAVPDPLPRVARLEGVVKLRLTKWVPYRTVVHGAGESARFAHNGRITTQNQSLARREPAAFSAYANFDLLMDWRNFFDFPPVH